MHISLVEYIGRIKKKDKNFKADSTNILQEWSWLQDQFKKRHSVVTYITVKNTKEERWQYVVNLETESIKKQRETETERELSCCDTCHLKMKPRI